MPHAIRSNEHVPKRPQLAVSNLPFHFENAPVRLLRRRLGISAMLCAPWTRSMMPVLAAVAFEHVAWWCGASRQLE